MRGSVFRTVGFRGTDWRGLAALGLLLLGGCFPEAPAPLSNPALAKLDARLVGTWRLRNPNGDVTYVHIGAEPEKPLDPGAATVEPGMMRFWLVGHAASNQQVGQPFGMRFFVSRVGDDDYANLVLPLDEQPLVPTGQPGSNWDNRRRYWFFKYRVSDSRLEVYVMPLDAAAGLIETGRLDGQVIREDSKIKRILLTEPPEKLAAYLAGGGDATLFPEASKSVYERVP